MAATAISYGTEVWLGELARSGWTLTVSERRPVGTAATLRLVEDEFEPLELLAPTRQVGVLAQDEHGSGVFVPCAADDEAHSLLQRVLAGVEA